MSTALSATVRLLGRPIAGAQLNRRLFGKFTEHLGRNVYGGAWAQLITNPGLAPMEVWPNRGELVRRLQQASVEMAMPDLASAAALGLPPYWVARGAAQALLSARRNRWVLAVHVGTAEAEGQLLTPLYLPAHRIREWRAQLAVRGAGGARLELREASSGQVRGAAQLPLTPDWRTVEVPLTLAGPHQVGTPYHLAISLTGPAALEIRQCLLWPADHLDGWDADVVRFLREAQLPLLRFPGGNFVSGYHWEDGVGPLEDRPIRPNPAWPDVEWNHVGTDEWLRLCELVGCEALICINAGDGTPEEAARWVAYVNDPVDSPQGARRALNGHPQPYGVHLWEVGNEIYGSWQIGHTDAVGYARRYREFARAMRAADPTIHLIANGDTEAWNRTLVFANREEVRSLSHHCLYSGFPEHADPERVYLEHMAFTPAYGQLWRELVRPLQEAGLPPVLAITDQQVFTQRAHLPTNATLTEALWTASILNEAIRADGLVELITHSALVNHGGGLRKERELVYAQPVWWTTHLYATAPAGLLRVPVAVDSPTFSVEPYRLRTVSDAPFLDAVALETFDSAETWLFLVNRHPERPLEVALEAPGRGYRQAEVTVLTGSSFLATNSWQQPAAVAPASERLSWPGERGGRLWLPACSLVRVRLR